MCPNPLGNMDKGILTPSQKDQVFQGWKGFWGVVDLNFKLPANDHKHNGHILGHLLEVFEGPGLCPGPLCLGLFAHGSVEACTGPVVLISKVQRLRLGCWLLESLFRLWKEWSQSGTSVRSTPEQKSSRCWRSGGHRKLHGRPRLDVTWPCCFLFGENEKCKYNRANNTKIPIPVRHPPATNLNSEMCSYVFLDPLAFSFFLFFYKMQIARVGRIQPRTLFLFPCINRSVSIYYYYTKEAAGKY